MELYTEKKSNGKPDHDDEADATDGAKTNSSYLNHENL